LFAQERGRGLHQIKELFLSARAKGLGEVLEAKSFDTG
jgi:hypothetical protein